MNKNMNRSLALLAASAALYGNAAQAATPLPVNEDFTNYSGLAAPAGFVVEADTGSDPITWNGQGTSQTGKGFWSLGSGSERAFGILETSSFGDARLALEITNPNNTVITHLRVQYKVEQWRDGVRVNSIRLKYSPGTTAGELPGGFSELPFLATTPAPKTANNDTGLDGNASGNYVLVDVTFVLPKPLLQGELGWLRWQVSTVSGSGTRDKLAIDDIVVTDATPAGTDQDWSGAVNDIWDTATANWSGSTWNNAGSSNAVFDSTGSGTATLGANINALNLKFDDSYIVDNSGAYTLTLNGVVDVAAGKVGTLDAPIGSASIGLFKIGTGTLQLTTGGHAYTGPTAVTHGTLALSGDDTVQIPAASTLTIGSGATFYLGGGSNIPRTLSGVTGADDSVINLGDNILVIDASETTSYRGDITGTGDLVKEGSGKFRLRSMPKAYTGDTLVNNGTLEVTENAILSTASISVDGSSSELLLSTDGEKPNHTLGGNVTLTGNASLASDTDATVVIPVASNIEIGTGGGRIYARGTLGTAKLTLQGTLSTAVGGGNLSRHGQGELVLAGGASGLTGTVTLANGLTTIPAGKTLGGSTVTLKGDNTNERPRVHGSGTIAGNLVFDSFSAIDLAKAAAGVTTVNGSISGLTAANVAITGTGSSVQVFHVLSGTVNGSLPAGVSLVDDDVGGVYVVITQ